MRSLATPAWNRRLLSPLPRLPRTIPPSHHPFPPACARIRQSTTHPQCRFYAKVTVSKTLDELPQGALQPLEPFPRDEDKPIPAFPPVIEQALQNMRRFPNCVLLTRVGSFYELYFKHAEEIGPMLGLRVTSKRISSGRGEVAMAGFPYYQFDRYLKVLVQDLGKHVAICDEYPNLERESMGEIGAAVGLHMFERRISRIVTPGTLIDEKFMDPYENNFLLAMVIKGAESGELQEVEEVEDLRKAEEMEEVKMEEVEEAEEMAESEGEMEPKEIKDLPVGLAWLDLSTGDFFTQQSNLSSLSADITRIGPREIVVDELLQTTTHGQRILKYLEDERYFITFYPQKPSSIGSWGDMLESEISKETIQAMEPTEVESGGALLDYVKARLPGISIKLQPPIRRDAKDTLIIDSNSMRGLEIRYTQRDKTLKGSLLHAVKRTVTKSGTRLLVNWLSCPITSIPTIDHRLNLVELFLNNIPIRQSLTRLLRQTHDSQKIVQKFSIGRGDADDLVSLARTIVATQEIHNLLNFHSPLSPDNEVRNRSSIESLLNRLEIPIDLAKKIISSIDEEGLMEKQRLEQSEIAQLAARAQAVVELAEKGEQDDEILEAQSAAAAEREKEREKRKRLLKGKRLVKEVDREKLEAWMMQKSASKTLSNLHKALDGLEEERVELEERIKAETDTPSFSLRWSPGLGHHCFVKGRDIDSRHPLLRKARNIGMSKTTKSFHLPDWTHLGTLIDQARLRIRAEEQRVFQMIRRQVIKELVKLRRNAQVLDELDIACSFAVLAQEQNFVRPILNLGVTHKIISGRHPVVEAGLRQRGRTFVANDCFVGDKERLWLITGPNMGGKSTFLRQNAVISILAQVGSFVPAEHAEIGIVDRIFSRVGSADNLFRDESTFMVEMLETAEILKKATPRSFVIMDEVGRGTTPNDGVAVAYACMHHLHEINRCRVLFATHFHEIARFANQLEGVGFYCTDLEEGEEGYRYIHKLKKGLNLKSHALKVAKLAGLPLETIRIAEQVLAQLEAQESSSSSPATTTATTTFS